MYDAYTRIFARCGLQGVPGRGRHRRDRRQVLARVHGAGRDRRERGGLLRSRRYAANIEKATSRGPPTPTPHATPAPAPEKFATPGVVTIEALAAAPYNVAAHRQIKTLVYIADSKPVLVLLRGDDQLNEAKLAGALGTGAVPAGRRRRRSSPRSARSPGSLGAVAATLPADATSGLRRRAPARRRTT